MWKFLAAVMVALLPLSAFAQNQPAQPAAEADASSGLGSTLAVTAGVVGGVVVADLLTGGGLTYSVLSAVGLRAAPAVAAASAVPVMTPALIEARQAGAVLGEMITPATEARDLAARRDLGFAAILAVGGLAGGWLVSHLTQ